VDSHFLVRRGDLDRLFTAEAACYIVSGYDGSGNYGDVIQAGGCMRTLLAYAPAMLPVPLVDWSYADEFAELERSMAEPWTHIVPLYYRTGHLPEPALPSAFVEVPAPPPIPSLLLAAGGGFLNEYWGALKLALVEQIIAWQEAAGKRAAAWWSERRSSVFATTARSAGSARRSRGRPTSSSSPGTKPLSSWRQPDDRRWAMETSSW
jgi:hypothetical protein